ncbi:branched-chain amino acid transport system / permease component domain-containing protein [Ditylenchus destructor]|nr:branched-chain amino acid transport system / permease component domain-containing protein [Ditylenchus destructor]
MPGVIDATQPRPTESVAQSNPSRTYDQPRADGLRSGRDDATLEVGAIAVNGRLPGTTTGDTVDGAIASILVLDGVTNGAIYALLALALVLVFAVTRVIFIPQGEFVAFGALTLAGLQLGQTPLTIHFLIAMALLAAVLDLIAAARAGRIGAELKSIVLRALPGVVIGVAALLLAPMKLPLAAQALITLAVVTPMGGLLYRLAYQSLADASVLVLLIVSVGVHFALTGLGLVFFGAEGSRNPSFWDASFNLGPLLFSGQTLIIVLVSLALIPGTVAVLRAQPLREGAARHRGEPPGRAADGHLQHLRGPAVVHAGGLHWRAVGDPDQPDHDDLLRQRLPHRPEGLRRRGLRRTVELPGRRRRRAAGGAGRVLQLLLGERLQGGHRLHLHPAALTCRRSFLHAGFAGEALDRAGASRRIVPPLLLIAIAVLPLLPVPEFWITQLNYIGLYAMVALGLVLLTGVGGLTSFGQAAFVGVGAYATALLSARYGLSPWLGLIVGMGVTLVISLVLALITLRMSGHYLPLATIAWALSLNFTIANLDVLGKYDGLLGVPAIELFGLNLADGRAIYYLIWLFAILGAIAVRNLLDSRPGRAIRALGGATVMAEAMGVSTFRYKVVIFLIAAQLASVSGWLFAHVQRTVNPSPFGLKMGIEYLFMAVVGGVSSVWGAFVGAGVFKIIEDQLKELLPRLLGSNGNFEIIVLGIVLVLMLKYAPKGLWPSLQAGIARRWPTPPRARDWEGAAALPARAKPQAGSVLLKVDKLRKQFGGLVAVNDVSFELRAGEIMGLIARTAPASPRPSTSSPACCPPPAASCSSRASR